MESQLKTIHINKVLLGLHRVLPAGTLRAATHSAEFHAAVPGVGATTRAGISLAPPLEPNAGYFV
jgi:hypothetical protein